MSEVDRIVVLLDGSTVEVMHGSGCVGTVERDHLKNYRGGLVLTTEEARRLAEILVQQADVSEEV